ncbi:MAG: hypothetical protein IPG72_06790 [Ardenticatenales bacterium]|nr:hypothetical protein [Ardenticatenales bacterium]
MDPHVPAAYLREPYRTSIETTVAARGDDARGPWIELVDTVLYPEGGGQPSDRGFVDGQAVADVQRVAGVIRHVLEAGAACPVPKAAVHVELDWDRRFDHMQQHTAQHVLTAVAADRFGWLTTAFHLGPDTSDIEVAVPELGRDGLEALESAVAIELRAAHVVGSTYVDPADLGGQGVRSRGLPEAHSGPVRLVSIGTLDVATCGGTHVANTAEVEALALLGAERMRGGVRLTWVAGGRVRRRMAAHEARTAVLRRTLGAADGALLDAVDAQMARLAAAERRAVDLEAEIVRSTAERIAAPRDAGTWAEPLPDGPPSVLTAYEADAPAARLTAIARAVTALRPDSLIVVAGGTEPDGRVVIASAASADDRRVRAVAEAVFAVLDGRGGGRNGLYQGSTPSPERLRSAPASLAAAVQAAWLR